MLVKDVMTTSPACCGPNDRIDTVAKLMLEHDCGMIPVCDGTRVIGVITDRDITCRTVATGKTPMAVPVSEVMTRTIHSIRDDETVEAAIDLMKTKQIRRVLVLNEKGKLVGVVSPADLAPIFASTNVADFLLAVSYWTHKTAVPAV